MRMSLEGLDGSAVVVALIAVFGGLPAILSQRRTERDKLTEQRVMRLLDSQEEMIGDHRKEMKQVHQKMDGIESENKRVWELFTLSVDQLSQWILWDRKGRSGDPPEVHPRLREHLPKELF